MNVTRLSRAQAAEPLGSSTLPGGVEGEEEGEESRHTHHHVLLAVPSAFGYDMATWRVCHRDPPAS